MEVEPDPRKTLVYVVLNTCPILNSYRAGSPKSQVLNTRGDMHLIYGRLGEEIFVMIPYMCLTHVHMLMLASVAPKP